MPLNTQRKNNIARTLAMYFAEKGKVPTYYEYKADSGRPKGMPLKFVLNNFKSWSAVLQYVKLLEPQLWDLATGKPAPKVEPTPEPKPKAKPAPKITPKAKPATNVASKKEK